MDTPNNERKNNSVVSRVVFNIQCHNTRPQHIILNKKYTLIQKIIKPKASTNFL